MKNTAVITGLGALFALNASLFIAPAWAETVSDPVIFETGRPYVPAKQYFPVQDQRAILPKRRHDCRDDLKPAFP
jgi:hypothetical protein